jgi:hypothetical protein
VEHGVDENNYEELFKTRITTTLDRSEDDMLWVEEENVDAERDVNRHQRAVPRTTIVMKKVITW